jgi:excisionase family DNA binding protein
MKAPRELHLEADSMHRCDQFAQKGAQMGEPSKRLYTLKQAGIYIGLSHWRVRSLIYSGQLAYVRLGRRILIDLKDLDALIDSKKQQECMQRR